MSPHDRQRAPRSRRHAMPRTYRNAPGRARLRKSFEQSVCFSPVHPPTEPVPASRSQATAPQELPCALPSPQIRETLHARFVNQEGRRISNLLLNNVTYVTLITRSFSWRSEE